MVAAVTATKKGILLVLWLVVMTVATASAYMPLTPENCTWKNFLPTQETYPEDSLQGFGVQWVEGHCQPDYASDKTYPVNGLDPDGRCSSSSSSFSSFGSNSWSNQANINANYVTDWRTKANFEVPTVNEVVDAMGSFVAQATIGTAMNIAGSIGTHFYQGLTKTDINTGASISRWDQVKNAALFTLDVTPMIGEVKIGGGAISTISNAGRVAEGISTPYGAAFQSSAAEAQAALQQVQNGTTVYKAGVLGRSETSASQFLSLENPLNSGYSARYGIPPQNSNFEFILSGRVQQGAPVITRPAPGIAPNPGGGIEAVTTPGSFRIGSFYMPD